MIGMGVQSAALLSGRFSVGRVYHRVASMLDWKVSHCVSISSFQSVYLSSEGTELIE